MVLGIIVGMVLATIIILATTAVQLSKQKYVQRMQGMELKHSTEKMIFTDRIQTLNKINVEEKVTLEAQIQSLTNDEEIAKKYKNTQGFYTHKKTRSPDNDDR